YTYDGVTVDNSVSSIKVTPMGGGTITVEGAAVNSGEASGDIALPAGIEKTITIVVTETDKISKTYTIKITRGADTQATPSFSPAGGAIAFGSKVTITSAGAEHIYYTIDGTNPVTAVGGSTLEYTGPVTVNSAVTIKAIAVKAGNIDSAIGSASYTQAASADLVGLVLTGSPTGFTFAGGTYTYDGVTVDNSVSSIKVTPMGGGTITVEGAAVNSGEASGDIALPAGIEKTITIVVTETGKVSTTYTIKITRGADTQATPSLSPAGGAIAFGSTVSITSAGADHIYYTIDGTNPDTAVGGSTLECTGPITVNSAVTIKAIAVKAGYIDSAIGSASYTQAASVDLTNISLSGSPAGFTFVGGTYTYEGVTVDNSVPSIKVTPTGAGTITVEGVAVNSGEESGDIALPAGIEKTITIVVIETGKSSKTYTIKVTRGADTQATPSFSPIGGPVAFGSTVTITSLGADHIYYTIDGTDPLTVVGGSTIEYIAPIPINSAVTIKAIAVKAGNIDSDIGSASYTQAASVDLTNISLSGSPVGFTFAGSTYTYSGVTVDNSVSSIKVTPMGGGTITVDGVVVNSGEASADIALTVGIEKTITIMAAEAEKISKTYIIKVTRKMMYTPSAPTGLTAKGGDKKVTLSWNSIAGAAYYSIYQSTTPGFYGRPLTTVDNSVNSYEATGLTNGVTYYFLIIAANEGGDSPHSNEVKATPKTVPGAPTNVIATAGNGEAAVSFTAPVDNGGKPITEYIVTSNPGNITVTGTSTTIIATGLTNGTAYTFTVKAVNEVGNGPDSAASNEATPTQPDSTGVYIESIIEIPEDVEPSKITTGVIVNSDGTYSHVPTVITIIDGKYYAKINSLKNGPFLLIYNQKTFKDVESHWSRDAVNDMASRLVINGVNDDMFRPDSDITRAEFAAIVVRALGLMQPGAGKNIFEDVTKDAWYYDAVAIAYEYGLIDGYGNGNFGPIDKITREHAMTIIARAMNITNLRAEFADGEAEKLLAEFGDSEQSSAYTKKSIAACVKAGVVLGKKEKMLATKDYITRAEAAVIVRRLLQKSNLI
ncbi:MAG: cadherin-like beta sandwich domain-containing protein, partial [Eubacteriales bacterium]|nr:cadherin-like beta sandwich domain-containing protein [Eubacteriales bacterium]